MESNVKNLNQSLNLKFPLNADEHSALVKTAALFPPDSMV